MAIVVTLPIHTPCPTFAAVKGFAGIVTVTLVALFAVIAKVSPMTSTNSIEKLLLRRRDDVSCHFNVMAPRKDSVERMSVSALAVVPDVRTKLPADCETLMPEPVRRRVTSEVSVPEAATLANEQRNARWGA